MTTTHMLETAGADIAYDVRGPLPTADGRPPLFMIGQPMDASGFATLASHFPDRTVVTYDPRGLGRSVRRDGRVDHAPAVQADDVHAVIEVLGAGPVELFASSGGAVAGLALVAAYPDDVTTLVAHEPPLIPVLPDAAAAERARAAVRNAEDFRECGQPVERSWRLAVATVGQVQWELIEPLDEESVYARVFSTTKEGPMTDEPQYDIEITRVLDAPPERVYRAFTDPEQFAHWYGPVGFPVHRDTVELDARVGGRQRFAMVSDDDPSMRTEFDGHFAEVVQNELLSSRGSWDGIPGQTETWPSNLRVEFHDQDGKTRLIVREGPHPPGTADLGRQAWEMMLPKLESLLGG